MTATVYRFFDADERLVYVGATTYLPERLANHTSGRAWWRTIVRAEFAHFDTLTEAFAAEKAAIENERPLINLPLTHAGKRAWQTRRENQEFAHQRGRQCTESNCSDCAAFRRERAAGYREAAKARSGDKGEAA